VCPAGLYSPFVRRVLVPAVVLLTVAIAAGCSEPPAKELHQAEGALAAARAAEAEVYAPQELETAEAALAEYDAAVAQGDYRLALSQAIEARDMAYEAARQAGERKADARSTAERLSAELERLVAMAEARLAGANRVTGTAASDLRAAIANARDVMQETRVSMDAHQYGAAADRLTHVVNALAARLSPASPPTGR